MSAMRLRRNGRAKKIETLIGEECSHATRGETAELRDEPRQIALLGV